ncbi:MAG: flavodoxin family protein [Firmicutes bacterium]|nr:flavodoxin family protein [Bacillota bacterium]MBQ7241662.1 flavodoxin family protein [Bacillota bacterium]
MTVLIHDLSDDDFSSLFPQIKENVLVISDHHDIKKCSECFYCWTKTPGKCRLEDNFNDYGDSLSKCKEIIVISRCKTGDFSPFTKNVLKRSACFVHTNINMENISAKENPVTRDLTLSAHFYGKIPDKSKELLYHNAREQGLTLKANAVFVHFARKSSDIYLDI